MLKRVQFVIWPIQVSPKPQSEFLFFFLRSEVRYWEKTQIIFNFTFDDVKKAC